MEDSIFTNIINGVIPCHKVYEDETTIAFMDIHPVQPGHVLVVPKKQVEFIWDLEHDDYHALMETVQKVGQRMREVLDKPYIGQQVIGVDVRHAHVHLIPFSTVEEYRNRADMNAEPDHDELAEIADKLAF